MKQCEYRSLDLKTVSEICPSAATISRAEGGTVSDAIKEFMWARNLVLVLHEWESEAEADKARLDWLESKPWPMDKWAVAGKQSWWRDWNPTTFREAIDIARQTPQPKVTIIATP